MARDGNAELHPSVRIVGCVLDQSVGQSDAARGDEKPAPIKSLHRGIQSDTQPSAEQGIISDITVLEDDVADGGTVLTHLPFGGTKGHPLGSCLDEKSTDRRLLVAFTGLGKYREKTSKRCVGNEPLLSVQDPSLPSSVSPSLDRSRIRSGVRFRQCEGGDDLAACQPRHETVLLRRRPGARQTLPGDTVMNADEVPHGRTGASELKSNFNFLHRVEAQPAMAFRVAKPEQTEIAHLVEQVLGRRLQQRDFPFSWNQALSDEPLDRVAEQGKGFCVDWHQFTLAAMRDHSFKISTTLQCRTIVRKTSLLGSLIWRDEAQYRAIRPLQVRTNVRL